MTREALTQEAFKQMNLALETMEAACKRIDELKAENKALKEALAQTQEQWGASAVTHPEYVAEQKRKTEELRSMLAEPVGFAGVKMWVGNQQVVKLLTQTELHHAIDPWRLVEQAAEMCIEELKGAA